jgi:hypothetical protein
VEMLTQTGIGASRVFQYTERTTARLHAQKPVAFGHSYCLQQLHGPCGPWSNVTSLLIAG